MNNHLPTILNVTAADYRGEYGKSFESGFHRSLAGTSHLHTTSLKDFLSPRKEIKVIILHWPEWIQKNLNITTEQFCALLKEWRAFNCQVGIVLHNAQPHIAETSSTSLYNAICELFDFAIHFEAFSHVHLKSWAKRHYLLPHPCMSLPGKPIQNHRNGVMILGHIRHKEEYSYILKCAIAARIARMKVFVGRFDDFRDQSFRVNQIIHVLFWRLILNAVTIRGRVPDSTLDDWREECKFMLMFRDESHLNSAIPYTALSNDFIPIGRAYTNVAACMQRFGLSHMNSTKIIDLTRYFRTQKKATKSSVFSKFRKDHSLQSISTVLEEILHSELTIFG